MELIKAAEQAIDAMCKIKESAQYNSVYAKAIDALRNVIANTQDWDEIEALRASLREHMAEIKRLNECLTWEQHRAEHVGTHGPGCAEWGPKHYECLLRAHKALKTQTERPADAGKTSDHIADAGKMVDQSEDALEMVASVREDRTVEPIGYFSINDYGNLEQNESGYGTPLYEAPPKRESLTEQQLDEMFDQAEIAIYLADRQRAEHLEVYSFGVRDAEKWHGIGGEE